MDYTERLERLDNHLREHPKDYQSVISRLKIRSEAYDHARRCKRTDRMQRLAEVRRKMKEGEYGEKYK